MAERRLPLSVQDDEGVSREGELLIVRAWRPDLNLHSDAEFTIVLAQEPLPPDARPVDRANVAVCAPSSTVRLPSAARETATAYAGTNGVSLRLPEGAMTAYATGILLTARPLSITIQDVFENGSSPRLDALARELLAADERNVAVWRAIDEVLSWPKPAAQTTRPERVRARLAAAFQQLGDRLPEMESEAVDLLRRLAEGPAPGRVASTQGVLVEAAALLRCLIEHPDGAHEMLAMRAYLGGAPPGDDDADLAADHAFTLEQLSFLTLLEQPHQLDRLRATFEMFRNAYAFAYDKHHGDYWSGTARLHDELAAATAAAGAVAQLNTLRALGRPVGEAALAAYRGLASQPATCDAADLAATLVLQPLCPRCGLTLDDRPPSAQAERALGGLRTALAAQQTRLAGEAVRRVLDRGGERLQQFLQVVQAADVAALTQILDDDLIGFLQELLIEPAAANDTLLREIARAYPVENEEEIEAAVEALRRLLLAQLAAGRDAAL